MRSQSTQLLKKVRSKEAGTHGVEPATEPARRQVLTASKGIITHEIAGHYREHRKSKTEEGTSN